MIYNFGNGYQPKYQSNTIGKIKPPQGGSGEISSKLTRIKNDRFKKIEVWIKEEDLEKDI